MRKYILIIIAYGIVTYLCLMPSIPDTSIPTIPNIDKVAHFLFYLFISTVSYFAIYKREIAIWKLYTGVLIFPIIFGGLIEILQKYFFPPRSAEWADFVADILGSLAGYWLGIFLIKIKNRFFK
ncbi:MAG: VanZ family protein [Bacteroidales bacterium]